MVGAVLDRVEADSQLPEELDERPLARPAWFETTARRNPAADRSRSPSAAPGIGSTSAGSDR
jgi:hypothetical protein